MAKECRKYGLALIVASHKSLPKFEALFFDEDHRRPMQIRLAR